MSRKYLFKYGAYVMEVETFYIFIKYNKIVHMLKLLFRKNVEHSIEFCHPGDESYGEEEDRTKGELRGKGENTLQLCLIVLTT